MNKIKTIALSIVVSLAACTKEKTCFECTRLKVYESMDKAIYDYRNEVPFIYTDCFRDPKDITQFEQKPVTVVMTYEQDTLRVEKFVMPLVNRQVRVTTSVKCERK